MLLIAPFYVIGEDKKIDYKADLPIEGLEAEVIKNFPKAIQIYKEAISKHPKNPMLWERISNIELSLKHYIPAADVLKEAIKIDPDNVEYYDNLSAIYSTAERPKESIEAIEKALQKQPNNLQFWRERADLASWLADVVKEEDSYRKILKLDPNNQYAIDGLKRIRQQREGNTKNTFTPRIPKYFVGRSIVRLAKNESAEYYARRSLEFLKEDKTDEAVVAIEKAVVMEPNNINYLKRRAAIASDRKQLGDFQRAQDSYNRILKVHKSDKKTLLEQARFNRDHDYLNAATRDYALYLKYYPNSQKIWIEYAQVLRWKGDGRSAKRALDTYLEKYGETKDYNIEKAFLLVATNRPKSSFWIWSNLLKKDPDNYDLLYVKSLALNNNNEKKEALETLGSILRLHPKEFGDNEELLKTLKNPLRPTVNLGIGTSTDSDGVKIRPIELSGKYFITPKTMIEAGANHSFLSVTPKTGDNLVTIQGNSNIQFTKGWLGASHQILPELRLGAKVGETRVQQSKGFFIYEISAFVNPVDKISFDFLSARELYAESPLATSLNIKRLYNRGSIILEPLIETTLTFIGENSHYSDKNRSYLIEVVPNTGVVRSQYISLDLGLDAAWQGYNSNPANGYYAPLSLKVYKATSSIAITQSEDVGYTFTVGAGVQKDETMTQYGFAGDIALEGAFRVFKDWQLTLLAGASRTNGGGGITVGRNYYLYTFNALITKRF